MRGKVECNITSVLREVFTLESDFNVALEKMALRFKRFRYLSISDVLYLKSYYSRLHGERLRFVDAY